MAELTELPAPCNIGMRGPGNEGVRKYKRSSNVRDFLDIIDSKGSVSPRSDLKQVWECEANY